MLFSEIIFLLQFQRKSVDSHLQSNMQDHLDLACVKLNSTQTQLDEQRDQLVETQAKLSLLTQDQLRSIKECQETKRKLEEKLSALQRQLDMKVITDKDDGNKRFIWKIKSFSESLRQAKAGVKEIIESDPFYYGCYGYKLKVSAHPYNHGCLSIDIVLMQGEYDDMLPWPFSKKITLTIIDQNKDLKERKNYVECLSPSTRDLFGRKYRIFLERPGEKMKAVTCQPLFIAHKALQQRRYIVNDTLFLQVDVEPDD